MSTLGAELQATIRNLEKLRDAQETPSDDLLAKLDTLYAQQIELIDAAIQKASAEYLNATTSMNEAATKTQEAINDLTKLEQAIEKVAKAIDTVIILLAVAA